MSMFSYRPLLRDLTAKVLREKWDPYEAYRYFSRVERSLGLERHTYLSTTITSGGHLHDPRNKKLDDVIDRNTTSAVLLASQLADDSQIIPQMSIEPYELGYCGWKQSDYLEFWLLVIGGLEVDESTDIDVVRTRHRIEFEHAGVDFAQFNSNDDLEERAKHYFMLGAAFAKLYETEFVTKPMQRMVRLIDPDTSLGAQTERVFARCTGIPVFTVSVVMPADPQNLFDVNRTLAEDTHQLISFGATVFDTKQHQTRLMLVKEDG
ncbi:MAG: hypothetical protein WBB39_01935 [Candidatus Saccharimonadales bacterium]